ncbi:hypothetical protein EB093_07795 [bacterium]|nr:hypothetical protein [bacterium]
MKKLIPLVLLSVGIVSSTTFAEESSDYWKKYAKQGQAASEVYSAHQPVSQGIQVGYGVWDYGSHLYMGPQALDLSYVRRQGDIQYEAGAQFSLSRANMRDNRTLVMTGSTTGYFRGGTLFAFRSGAKWQFIPEWFVGITGRFYSLNDSTNDTGVSGLSIGLTASKDLPIDAKTVIAPYAEISYDSTSTGRIGSQSGNLSGLNGTGLHFGVSLIRWL